MIFDVKKIINFISQGTTLLPGDVIMTGTPQGTQYHSPDLILSLFSLWLLSRCSPARAPDPAYCPGSLDPGSMALLIVGVGMGRKPQLWLKDGDIVEVELENVGKCVNKVVFEKGGISSKL